MLDGFETTENGVTQIRDIALLPGETIDRVFTPGQGLTDQPPATGQLLVATNLRVLAFCRTDGRNETFMVPMAELKGVAVSARSRTVLSVIQGVLLSLGGLILYMAVAYWLTGQFNGPSIPALRMDLAPFLALLIALGVLAAIGRHYFTKVDGTVTFRGSNWTFAFPYRGERAGREIYEVVNSVFLNRHWENGTGYLWED